VHRSAASDLPSSQDVRISEVFLVGVAEEGSFWKDLRRILFSGSTMTIMCRVALNGLQREWTPVKLADLYKQVIPALGPQLDSMSSQLVHGFRSGASEALAETGAVDERKSHALRLYATYYAAEFSSAPLDLPQFGRLLEPDPELDFDDARARRKAVEPLTEKLREMLGQEPNLTLEAELRGKAMGDAGFGDLVEQSAFSDSLPEAAEDVYFLEAEFVAIYW
jgi:hypothetical protein